MAHRPASSKSCTAVSSSPTPTGQFGVADLLPPVEDVDERVTGHRDIELELAELKGGIDPRTRTRR
jgi:hypothetical protein